MSEQLATQAAGGLSGLGMAIMIVSLAAVLTLAIWCYAKILSAPPADDE